MTQHNRRLSPKRIVLTLDSRTTIITSDKALMKAMWPPARSARSAVAGKRAHRRDRRGLDRFESAHLHLRLAPNWAQYAAEFAPAVGVKAPTTGTTSPATPRPQVIYAGATPLAARWWNVSTRTAGIAVLAAAGVAAASVATVIVRGDVR